MFLAKNQNHPFFCLLLHITATIMVWFAWKLDWILATMYTSDNQRDKIGKQYAEPQKITNILGVKIWRVLL